MSTDPPQPTPRQCGSCVICCKLLEVIALDKPVGRLCQHAGPAGCGRYETRPAECRHFRCLWLQGMLGDDDRPDRMRVVFWAEALDGAAPAAGQPAPLDPSRVQIYAAEDFPGAASRSKRARQIIRGFLARGFKVTLRNEQHRVQLSGDGRALTSFVDPQDPLKRRISLKVAQVAGRHNF